MWKWSSPFTAVLQKPSQVFLETTRKSLEKWESPRHSEEHISELRKS